MAKKKPLPEPLLVDTAYVAALLGVSERTVARLTADRLMPPPLALGVLRKWPRRAVEEWIAGGCRPVAPAGFPAGGG